jgi:hypothetical protein
MLDLVPAVDGDDAAREIVVSGLPESRLVQHGEQVSWSGCMRIDSAR